MVKADDDRSVVVTCEPVRKRVWVPTSNRPADFAPAARTASRADAIAARTSGFAGSCETFKVRSNRTPSNVPTIRVNSISFVSVAACVASTGIVLSVVVNDVAPEKNPGGPMTTNFVVLYVSVVVVVTSRRIRVRVFVFTVPAGTNYA